MGRVEHPACVLTISASHIVFFGTHDNLLLPLPVPAALLETNYD